jgi:multidrug transporter EmrE-like cation transporter
MGIIDIAALATVEIFGDFNFRWYAQTNVMKYFWQGVLGYIGVIFFLIRSLRTDNLLFVNGVWDGMSSLIESVAAYYYLGDRLTSVQQYVGLLLTIAGVVLMKMGR